MLRKDSNVMLTYRNRQDMEFFIRRHLIRGDLEGCTPFEWAEKIGTEIGVEGFNASHIRTFCNGIGALMPWDKKRAAASTEDRIKQLEEQVLQLMDATAQRSLL